MDDGHIWFELFIIVLLVLGNAVCSLAEIAIVGARKTKLQEMADEGKRGAAQALKLTGRKEELFSTIQVGITTISIVTGMFSGASLAGPLADFLGGIPVAGAFLAPLSMFFVMALVTYFALIIGELGVRMGGETPVSEEEIRVLLHQGAQLGTIDKKEPEMIENVFSLNDLTASDTMTPRPQLVWIDLEDTEENIWEDINHSTHFRLPVGNGSLDDFKGLADMSEVLRDQHRNPGKSIKASIMDSVYRPLLIPETLILTKVLALFKDRVVHEAVVIDEYGTLTGLVTLHDVLEEIVGDMPGDKEDMLEAQNKFIRRTENSWLVEGLCTIDEFREYFHIEEELPGEAEDDYKTLGGFITYLFGYIPKETEKISFGRFTFEVMDCDNRRVDKVLVTEGEG